MFKWALEHWKNCTPILLIPAFKDLNAFSVYMMRNQSLSLIYYKIKFQVSLRWWQSVTNYENIFERLPFFICISYYQQRWSWETQRWTNGTGISLKFKISSYLVVFLLQFGAETQQSKVAPSSAATRPIQSSREQVNSITYHCYKVQSLFSNSFCV